VRFVQPFAKVYTNLNLRLSLQRDSQDWQSGLHPRRVDHNPDGPAGCQSYSGVINYGSSRWDENKRTLPRTLADTASTSCCAPCDQFSSGTRGVEMRQVVNGGSSNVCKGMSIKGGYNAKISEARKKRRRSGRCRSPHRQGSASHERCG